MKQPKHTLNEADLDQFTGSLSEIKFYFENNTIYLPSER